MVDLEVMGPGPVPIEYESNNVLGFTRGTGDCETEVSEGEEECLRWDR